MKHVICAAILALFAPITALSATAQLEETSDERVALPLPPIEQQRLRVSA